MIVTIGKSGCYLKMGVSLTQDHQVDTRFYYELKEGDIILDEGQPHFTGGKQFQTLHILRRID